MKKILDVWISKKSDLFAYRTFEVRLAFFFSFVLTCILIIAGIYNDFSSYIEGIKNLIIYVMQAFIGLLGTILAGLSIMLFLFTSKGLEKIGQNKETGHKMLLSYVFLCLNIVFVVFVLLILFLVLLIPKNLVNILTFTIITFSTIYYVFFVLFYTVALINNAVVLFRFDSKIRSKISSEELLDSLFKDVVDRIKIYISLSDKKDDISLKDIKKVAKKIINSLNYTEEIKHNLMIRIINYFGYLK